MKLLAVLMLATLPLFCYAGAGCPLIKEVVTWTTDPAVDPATYANKLQPWTAADNNNTAKALMTMKECFNSQSQETLDNVNLMMNTIYNSLQCSMYS